MPTLAVPAIRSIGAGSHSPVVEPAVDDDLHRRIFPEDLKQRPTRVLAGSRNHDEERAFAVFHAGISLVKVKSTPGTPRKQQEVLRPSAPPRHDFREGATPDAMTCHGHGPLVTMTGSTMSQILLTMCLFAPKRCPARRGPGRWVAQRHI